MPLGLPRRVISAGKSDMRASVTYLLTSIASCPLDCRTHQTHLNQDRPGLATLPGFWKDLRQFPECIVWIPTTPQGPLAKDLDLENWNHWGEEGLVVTLNVRWIARTANSTNHSFIGPQTLISSYRHRAPKQCWESNTPLLLIFLYLAPSPSLFYYSSDIAHTIVQSKVHPVINVILAYESIQSLEGRVVKAS